jgi:hypothetical protein
MQHEKRTPPKVVLRFTESDPPKEAVLPSTVKDADVRRWVWLTVDGWGFEPEFHLTNQVALELIEARRTGIRPRDLKGGPSRLEPGSRPVKTVPFDTSRSVPPTWAWQDRYVTGYLNLILGEEKVGKGVLAAWTIARLTRGELPGAHFGKPAHCLVVADEDQWHHVWVPRLYAADVNGPFIHKVETVGGEIMDVFTHTEAIRNEVERVDAALLYLDALDDLLADTNAYNAREVRAALHPLRTLADEAQVAVVGSKHPNKSGTTFRELLSGSPQYVAAARSSLLLTQDPDGSEESRVVAVGPGNLARKPKALAFRIEGAEFELNDYHWDVPVATGFKEIEKSVAELIAGEAAKPGPPPSADRGIARAAIEAALTDGEPHLASPIRGDLEKRGISKNQIGKARDELAIQTSYTKEAPPKTLWALP